MSLPLKLIVCVLAIELLGVAGAFFTSNSIPNWYGTLNEPAGRPPNWVFGPVWTTLYALIGIAFTLVWHRADPGPQKKSAVLWFFIQLGLNLAWTPIFFGAHQLVGALVVIGLLLIAIFITIQKCSRLVPVTRWLLLPYLLWVSYATYLNAGYAFLN